MNRAIALPAVQIALAGTYVVWVMSRAGSDLATTSALGLPTLLLGGVAVVGEIAWRRNRPINSLALVGRAVGLGAFVVAACLMLIAVGLEWLTPALSF